MRDIEELEGEMLGRKEEEGWEGGDGREPLEDFDDNAETLISIKGLID